MLLSPPMTRHQKYSLVPKMSTFSPNASLSKVRLFTHDTTRPNSNITVLLVLSIGLDNMSGMTVEMRLEYQATVPICITPLWWCAWIPWIPTSRLFGRTVHHPVIWFRYSRRQYYPILNLIQPMSKDPLYSGSILVIFIDDIGNAPLGGVHTVYATYLLPIPTKYATSDTSTGYTRVPDWLQITSYSFSPPDFLQLLTPLNVWNSISDRVACLCYLA